MTSRDRTAKGLWWDRAYSVVEGCTHTSAGCANCWSASSTAMRSKQSNPKIIARYGGLTTDAGKFNGKVRFMSGSLDQPLRVRKPTTWAVWNDLFHHKLTDKQIAAVFGVMAATPRHQYVILTKRPDRALQWFKWVAGDGAEPVQACRSRAAPATGRNLLYDHTAHSLRWPLLNVILCTTAENRRAAEERIGLLVQAPAARRGLSLEPLLGPVNLGLFGILPADWGLGYSPAADHLHWVAVGAESGPKARPCKIEWVRSIVKQCAAAGIACFVKQIHLNDDPHRLSKNPDEWPEDLRVRQLPWVSS